MLKGRLLLLLLQDGNGGLWLVDLILRAEYEPAKCLRRFHAGPVADMQACPWGPYIASLGDAGSLHLYDYEQMVLVFRHVFNAKGRALIWVPLEVRCNLNLTNPFVY